MKFNVLITLNPGKIGKAFNIAVSKVEKIINEVKSEIKSIRARDPAAISDIEVLLLYPGLHALLAYKFAHYLHNQKRYFPARTLSQYARFVTGIEIHPGAKIGKGLFIDHGSSVVIGETTVVGDNCTIYQGVTLGGTGKDLGKRHPTIGNRVMIGAGAKVLGPIYIGDDAKIAAGAVVLKDVPSFSTAVGIPAKIVRRCGQTAGDNLDQINIPDPVMQELNIIKARLDNLEKKEK